MPLRSATSLQAMRKKSPVRRFQSFGMFLNTDSADFHATLFAADWSVMLFKSLLEGPHPVK